MYDFVPSLVDDDVLILPGAVSTPVDDGSYFFNVGSWLVNLPTMVSLSDWRESFHSFNSVMLGCDSYISWSYVCKMNECMMTLLVYKDICGKLLIVSGDVEINPGPSKTCPKCEKSVPNRTMVCSCGYSFRKRKQNDPKVVSENKRIAMKIERTSETSVETILRKESNRLSMKKARLLETEDEALCRKESNRLSMKKARFLETEDEALCRKENDRLSKIKVRSLETVGEALCRKESNRLSMKKARLSETENEALCRKESNRLSMKKARLLETEDEALCRKESNRLSMKKARLLETEDEALCRKESNKLSMKKARSLETVGEALCRKESNRLSMKEIRTRKSFDEAKNRKELNKLAMRNRRATAGVSIDCAISSFLSKIRSGPEFVCCVCHRLMYKSCVNVLNVDKYEKANEQVVENALKYQRMSFDSKQWICKTCDSALSRSKLPVQAKANGLQLDTVPPELNDLNVLELRLISLRIPFMKLLALPSGKQRSIHGPAVNVPSKIDNICTLLPRLTTEAELIPLKLKRKLRYKGHYMYDFVRPDKIMIALRWLKENNSLYSNVDINDSWITDQLNNNDFVEQSATGQNNDVNNQSSVTSDLECNIPAMNVLYNRAKARGFTVHNVPGDGSCFFSSVSYQLPNIGIQSIDASKLRSTCMLVEYLRENPIVNNTHYCNFLGHSFEVEDDIQAQLEWDKFLDQLKNGAWADNIAIQGLSDMLNIRFCIVSTQNPNDVKVYPSSGISIGTIYLGLLGQMHYVGLDKTVEQLHVNTNDDENEATIDNENIHEGDEYNRQITGGPMESCMSLENPEADASIYSVAPAEGERPLSFMNDKTFEAMCNPNKFPYGTGTFHTTRERKLTYRKYFNQRLLDVDGRFARDLDYLFVAQYIVEAKQVLDDGSHFIWRRKPGRRNDALLTAYKVKNQTLMNEFICKDKAYRFMKNVRGSPAYYQRTFYDLLAMIRQLGTPTWFLTLSAADMKWPDMIATIAKQYGVNYSDEDVAGLTYEEKSNWLRRNPVTAARHFQYRLNTFFNDFLKSKAKPLGEITDYAIRVEFQARGSPHAHCVIWVKDAPKFDHDSDEDVCNFIDEYVSCSIPENDGKLKELVLSLQQHKHSSYCKRGKSCRFHFPQPPSSNTVISYPSDDDSELKKCSEVLNKVREYLINSDTDLTIEQLLNNVGVDLSDYLKALQTSLRGNAIVLKRMPNECKINNYNSHVMLAWQANMDIQYVLNAYACVMYVASYMMKSERAMGELLKNVANENRSEELLSQLRKVGSAFLNHREVSAQEAVYRILSIPMKQLSRSVVFVDTNSKCNRIGVLKDLNAISQLDDDDQNVFQKSLLDRYEHRPPSLDTMCLAEFAANYVTNYQQEDDDVLPNKTLVSTCNTGSKIHLTNNFGTMHKRSHEAVIRFHRHNKDKEPSNYYRAKLMLYYPWHNEELDLIGNCATYEEHYNIVRDVVIANETNYNAVSDYDVEYDEAGPPQHLWVDIAPGTEESRLHSLQENEESLTEMNAEDIRDNDALMTNISSSSCILQRYVSASNHEIIAPEEYRRMLRQLNRKQKDFVLFHRSWCKNVVTALKTGQPIKPYQVFLSGPGGVGKSHVIKLVQSDTIRILKLSGIFKPDDVIVLLTAPTGVAAFNIGGMTLHSALLLGCTRRTGFQPLSNDRLTTLRCKLSKLMLIIIDEVSMVGSNMLLEIHKRLQQIKGVTCDVMFGDVSVLAVGDLYQLPPIGQPAVFDKVTDSYAQLYKSGSLWVDGFKMIELTEIMRQKEDVS